MLLHNVKSIQGLYSEIQGYRRVYLGARRHNGQYHGSYCLGFAVEASGFKISGLGFSSCPKPLTPNVVLSLFC